MKVNLRKMQPPVHPVERAQAQSCVHQLELLHSPKVLIYSRSPPFNESQLEKDATAGSSC
jgi:hypothetical protein